MPPSADGNGRLRGDEHGAGMRRGCHRGHMVGERRGLRSGSPCNGFRTASPNVQRHIREMLDTIQGSLTGLQVENDEDEEMDFYENTEPVQPDMEIDERVEAVQPGGHQDEEDAEVRQVGHPHQVGDEHGEPVQTGDQQEGERQQGLQDGESSQDEQLPQVTHPHEDGEDLQEPGVQGGQEGLGEEGMEALEEGELLLLEPRVSPVVPPPGAVAPDWGAIDSLGAWDSFLCKFPMLQEVPEQHKGAWAAAWGEVLARWERAEC